MQFVDNVTPQNFASYQANYGSTNDADFMHQMWNDWATMYYQNAYNVQMQNYMNEYNSPKQQMLRYLDAGLNPYLVASQGSPGNISSVADGAAPKGSSIPVTSVQKAQMTINSIKEIVGAATDLYDYVRFGRPIRQDQQDTAMYNTRLTQYRAQQAGAEADWSQYWNYGNIGANGPLVSGSPRAQYMQSSTDYKAAQISQIQSLVSTIYPNQSDQAKAMAALNDYRLQILQGQNDIILQIDTGNNTGDSILKALAFKLMNSNWF